MKLQLPDLKTLWGDCLGGLTAMIVGLPIGMAFGVASGIGALAGLYSAVAVGFFAAILGGTRQQVSGPTPPMTVAMTVVVTVYAAGSLTTAFFVVIMAGAIQILLGLSRIGQYIVYTPYIVISGFMSGIGLVVILIQLPPFMGSDPVPGGAVGALLSLPEVINQINFDAFCIAAISLLVGISWPARLARYLPRPMVSLVAGSAAGILVFTGAPILGELPIGLPDLQFTSLEQIPDPAYLLRLIEPAVILALLGSVDSLLTSLVADSISGTNHNSNKELIGQGIGNMVAGFIGALPGAGTTTNTVTNIRSGGTTRISSTMCALFLFAAILGLGHYLSPVPLAALAGVLIVVGLDVIDWPLMRRLHRLRPRYLFALLITMSLTIFIDVVTAVAIGLIVAGMTHAAQLESLELDNIVSVPMLDKIFLYDEDSEPASLDQFSARAGLVDFRGTFTVSSSRNLHRIIGEDIKAHELVIFNFSNTIHIDDSVAMVIVRLINATLDSNTQILVTGLKGDTAKTLDSLDVLARVPNENILETMDECKQFARKMFLPA